MALVTRSIAADAIDAIVDLDRYPIHHLGSSIRSELVAQTRQQMDAVGCFRIGDFINSDLLPRTSLLNQLYDNNVMTHFIWESLGVAQPIYQWADPLGRNPYGVMETNHYFPWHFDGNEFTVSILVQKTEVGGVFEYVPDIRAPGHENFERVQAVLEGGREGVQELDLVPGDLQLFKGRYSLHRVTHIEGPTTRYIALPTYVHDPWRMNRPHHSVNYYGRATDLHHARADALADGLVD